MDLLRGMNIDKGVQMFSFGNRSERNLETCDTDLQIILREAIKGKYDFSVICGHRGPKEQNEAFKKGNSDFQYPDSKHNGYPSKAVDIVPYPLNYSDIGSFYILAGYIMRVADEKNIKIRFGGDWDSDGKTLDQNLHDIGHIELV